MSSARSVLSAAPRRQSVSASLFAIDVVVDECG
jgi:hypothetical protein